MKRLFPVLFLCLFIFLFTSCREKAEFFELAICGSYGVPGMYCEELKGDSFSCNIIDTDSYGRILFEYKTKSNISHQDEIVYVICQKYDSDYVYFYEDACYLFAKDFENESMYLKERNDWDKPLDETKMSRRKNSMTFDLRIAKSSDLRLSEIEEACALEFQVDASEIELHGFVDCDPSGKELLLVSNSKNVPQIYFALFDTDGTVALLEIHGQSVDQSQLTEFKQENSWVYGF